MFAPPITTRETFEERLKKSPMYINVGDELHWPSTMSSEDGTELTLGVDGSLLIKKQAAAAEEEEAESDPVVQPVVTLIAADVRKSSRALEKRRMASGKDGSKVPGRTGSDAGRRTILKITDMGDVEVTIDGKKVLRKTAPDNGGTWSKKLFDRVRCRKKPRGEYQMHMISDGFEVRLGGAVIWAMHSTDLAPVTY